MKNEVNKILNTRKKSGFENPLRHVDKQMASQKGNNLLLMQDTVSIKKQKKLRSQNTSEEKKPFDLVGKAEAGLKPTGLHRPNTQSKIMKIIENEQRKQRLKRPQTGKPEEH